MNIRYKLKTRKAVYPLKIFSQFYIRNLAASWVIFLLSHVRPTAQIVQTLVLNLKRRLISYSILSYSHDVHTKYAFL